MTDARDGGERWIGEAVELLTAEGGESLIRVRESDHSMQPTLEPGTRLLVRFCAGRLRRGDLVLFRQADYLVIHRLLGRARFPDGRPCLRTRGDWTPGLDPPLAHSDVVGRAVTVETRHGWRSFEGARARSYALGAALHDLFWAGVGVVVHRAGNVLLPVRPLVTALDRGLLRAAHFAAFRVLHPRVEAPRLLARSGSGTAAAPGPGAAVGPS